MTMVFDLGFVQLLFLERAQPGIHAGIVESLLSIGFKPNSFSLACVFSN